MEGIILTSPNGTKYKLTVADDGKLKTSIIKNNTIAVIIPSGILNGEQCKMLYHLTADGNSLQYIATSIESIEIDHWFGIIRSSDEILLMNTSKKISSDILKLLKYAIKLNKDIRLYEPISEKYFTKLLEE